MYISKNDVNCAIPAMTDQPSHLCICCIPKLQMEFLSSHNCKVALMVSLHNGLAQRQCQPFCEPVADPGIGSGGGGGGGGTGEDVAGGGHR